MTQVDEAARPASGQPTPRSLRSALADVYWHEAAISTTPERRALYLARYEAIRQSSAPAA
jgi:hypothetical protein